MVVTSMKDVLEVFYRETVNMQFYNLDNIKKLCEFFGNPQNSFKSIHITGTNGKGSVAKMTAQILQDAGYCVGTFTSPHLCDIRERWIINGQMVPEDLLIEITNKTLSVNFPISFFERATLVGFLLFQKYQVDYAALEVGMGGRLDATNIIHPVITAITSVGLDHTIFLGDTVEAISYEKAGILKHGIPVVVNHKNEVIEKVAQENGVPIIYTDTLYETNLLGHHQERNASIAYEIASYLKIPENIILAGLLHVNHPGRIDYITRNVFIDGAHNEDGLRELGKYLQEIASGYRKIYYCISFKKGKNIDLLSAMGSLVDKEMVLVNYEDEQLELQATLGTQFDEQHISYMILLPEQIMKRAEKESDSLFAVFGSLYMIGAFLKYKVKSYEGD